MGEAVAALLCGWPAVAAHALSGHGWQDFKALWGTCNHGCSWLAAAAKGCQALWGTCTVHLVSWL